MAFFVYIAIVLVSISSILLELDWLTKPRLEKQPVQVARNTAAPVPVPPAPHVASNVDEPKPVNPDAKLSPLNAQQPAAPTTRETNGRAAETPAAASPPLAAPQTQAAAPPPPAAPQAQAAAPMPPAAEAKAPPPAREQTTAHVTPAAASAPVAPAPAAESKPPAAAANDAPRAPNGDSVETKSKAAANADAAPPASASTGPAVAAVNEAPPAPSKDSVVATSKATGNVETAPAHEVNRRAATTGSAPARAENPPPPPAPRTQVASAPAQETPSEPARAAPAAVSSSVAVAGAPKTCDVRACASSYQSFRAQDCTYQPLQGGARQLCTKRGEVARAPARERSPARTYARSDRDSELRQVERTVRRIAPDDEDDFDPPRPPGIIVFERGYRPWP